LRVATAADEKERPKPTDQKDTSYYSFFGSPFSVELYCRDLAETKRRYPRLRLLSEFSRSKSAWQNAFPSFFPSHYGDNPFQSHFPQHRCRFPISAPLLDDFVHIECDNEFRLVEDKVEAPEPPPVDGVEYSVKLMLCCGMPPNAIIKKEKSELALVGGSYDQDLDGGDWRPTPRDLNGVPLGHQGEQEDTGFIRCAIRHTKEQINLDLTEATHWWRFLEIHYSKDFDHRHVSLIYVVSLSNLVPSYDSFVQIWKERETVKLARHLQKEHLAKLALEKAKQERLKKEIQKKEANEGDATNKPIQITLAPESTSNPEIEEITIRTPPENDVPPIEEELILEPELPQPTELELPEDDPSAAKQTSPKQDDPPSDQRSLEPQPIEEQIDMSKAPKQSGLFVSIRRVKYQQLKAVLISLHGLLEYTLEDDKPDTFEVSLAAENFCDLLQRDFGTVIVETVTSFLRKKTTQERLASEFAITGHRSFRSNRTAADGQ